MNRRYDPSSRLSRSVLAFVACVVTLVVLGSIQGLAEHYGAAIQVAATPSVAAHG